jgi:hypothetical protein
MGDKFIITKVQGITRENRYTGALGAEESRCV